MLVRDIMQREVATISPAAALALAARALRDRDIGCLPVIEEGRLVGMVTDRDIIVRGVAEGLDPHRAMVREVMSVNAIACAAEDSVDQARQLMTEHLIRHLPVLDRRGRLVGLVSLRDITGQLAKCKPHQVTFYKQYATRSGDVRNVEVAKMYLSPATDRDEVLAEALARFEQDRGLASWEQAADGYELEESCGDEWPSRPASEGERR